MCSDQCTLCKVEYLITTGTCYPERTKGSISALTANIKLPCTGENVAGEGNPQSLTMSSTTVVNY